MPGPRNRSAGRFKGGVIRGGGFTRGSRGASISGGQAGTLGLGRGYGSFLTIAPGLSWGVQYAGFRNIAGIISRAMFAAPSLADQRLTQHVIEVYRRSQALVPVSSGELQKSGYIRMINKNTVEIGYTAPYAVNVHENHPTHSKFLETPFREVFKKFEGSFSESRDSDHVFFGVKI